MLFGLFVIIIQKDCNALHIVDGEVYLYFPLSHIVLNSPPSGLNWWSIIVCKQWQEGAEKLKEEETLSNSNTNFEELNFISYKCCDSSKLLLKGFRYPISDGKFVKPAQVTYCTRLIIITLENMIVNKFIFLLTYFHSNFNSVIF